MAKAMKAYKRGGEVKRTAETSDGVRYSSVRRGKRRTSVEVDSNDQRGRGKGKEYAVKTKQRGIDNDSGLAKRTKVKSVDAATGEVRKRVAKPNKESEKYLPSGYNKDRTRVVSKKSAAKKVARMEAKSDRMDKKATYKGGGKVVAQGADKKDVRRERKMDRISKRRRS